MYKLGIDVGGTNIDFAILNQSNDLLFGTKILYNQSLSDCFKEGVQKFMTENNFNPQTVSCIQLGTTMAVNSILELKSLYKVGVLRIAGHSPELPPAYSWPKAHRDHIVKCFQTISGGREYNNVPLSLLSDESLHLAVQNLIADGAESIAIISVFSPFYADEELYVKKYMATHFPSIPITLSHEIGGIGFIARENTTILNAALNKVMATCFNDFMPTLTSLGFNCDCFITQNDGTLLSLDEAIHYPVRTISSGPTNSIIGACQLSNCKDGIVIDIGGTSTDLGVIQNGLPLYSISGGTVANISCQLLMPDVHVLAMGGGSIIREVGDHFEIGPDSLGSDLTNQCISRGGSCITLFDVGQVIKENQSIGDLTVTKAKEIMLQFLQTLNTAIDKLLPDTSQVPILLVGGGAANIPDDMLDKRFTRPRHYQIANAYGAALSEVAGKVDCVVAFNNNQEMIIESLINEAKLNATKKGASLESLRVTEKKVLPLHYMPEPRFRVMITVVGRAIMA